MKKGECKCIIVPGRTVPSRLMSNIVLTETKDYFVIKDSKNQNTKTISTKKTKDGRKIVKLGEKNNKIVVKEAIYPKTIYKSSDINRLKDSFKSKTNNCPLCRSFEKDIPKNKDYHSKVGDINNKSKNRSDSRMALSTKMMTQGGGAVTGVIVNELLEQFVEPMLAGRAGILGKIGANISIVEGLVLGGLAALVAWKGIPFKVKGSTKDFLWGFAAPSIAVGAIKATKRFILQHGYMHTLHGSNLVTQGLHQQGLIDTFQPESDVGVME